MLRSEATGEEIQPHEVIKGYEIAPNEFAAIDPQEIKAAEIESSDAIDLFHFVKATTLIRSISSGLTMLSLTAAQKGFTRY